MSTVSATPTAAPDPAWRSLYPIHPCADVFPMMSDDELDKLGRDIFSREGLIQSVVLWRENGRTWLLDGRNRLAALQRLGARFLPDHSVRLPGGKIIHVFATKDGITDPAAYVIAANIHRRHLSKEERAELIVKTVAAAKNDSAKVARSFNPTANKRGGSTKDPVLEQAKTVAKQHGISPRTVERARAKVHPRVGRVDVDRLRRERVARKKERELLRGVQLELIKRGYLVLAAKSHPDKGGSAEGMARLNRARDLLKAATA